MPGSLTAHPWKQAGSQKERLVFQSAIFQGNFRGVPVTTSLSHRRPPFQGTTSIATKSADHQALLGDSQVADVTNQPCWVFFFGKNPQFFYTKKKRIQKTFPFSWGSLLSRKKDYKSKRKVISLGKGSWISWEIDGFLGRSTPCQLFVTPTHKNTPPQVDQILKFGNHQAGSCWRLSIVIQKERSVSFSNFGVYK